MIESVALKFLEWYMYTELIDIWHKKPHFSPEVSNHI